MPDNFCFKGTFVSVPTQRSSLFLFWCMQQTSHNPFVFPSGHQVLSHRQQRIHSGLRRVLTGNRGCLFHVLVSLCVHACKSVMVCAGECESVCAGECVSVCLSV